MVMTEIAEPGQANVPFHTTFENQDFSPLTDSSSYKWHQLPTWSGTLAPASSTPCVDPRVPFSYSRSTESSGKPMTPKRRKRMQAVWPDFFYIMGGNMIPAERLEGTEAV